VLLQPILLLQVVTMLLLLLLLQLLFQAPLHLAAAAPQPPVATQPPLLLLQLVVQQGSWGQVAAWALLRRVQVGVKCKRRLLARVKIRALLRQHSHKLVLLWMVVPRLRRESMREVVLERRPQGSEV